MRIIFAFILILYFSASCGAQKVSVGSPNKNIEVTLHHEKNEDVGRWFLKVQYLENNKTVVPIKRIDLGISRNDQDFFKDLKFIKATKPLEIKEQYSALHGKRSERYNLGNEIVVHFENPSKAKLNVIVRAYNDGVTFRYEFPEKTGSYIIQDEYTSFSISDDTSRWLEKFDLSNEGLYTEMENDKAQGDWCYPGLFKMENQKCWYLIHEADLNRSYAATKLSNKTVNSEYKIALPSAEEGVGSDLPKINLPWKSPWRVIIMGSLADVVESTLVEDVSSPSILIDTDWIKPGLVSWNYWSNNHGTKDYRVVTHFAELAAEMGWPYTLLDWEWDQMANGGNLENAIEYIHSKGVKPLMWYNSGMFKWITSTPVDRMKTHENRMAEFEKLNRLGVSGIKVDFFLSEKQDMINYYLDILEDAAKYKIMVYFHGCLVPRGWQRTYPHLMTFEAVRGAEWYNNGPELTMTAPKHNNVLPYTRNVIGSMDYTPVTFTNSQFPHITSYGHELALSVVFESALQHMADRPEGYARLPYLVKSFLKQVPAAWDDTKLLDGYPGKFTVIARRKGNAWYIGGINAEEKIGKTQELNFDFLPKEQSYKLTLISDGVHDTTFSTQFKVVDKNSKVNVDMLPRGGFVAILSQNI